MTVTLNISNLAKKGDVVTLDVTNTDANQLAWELVETPTLSRLRSGVIIQRGDDDDAGLLNSAISQTADVVAITSGDDDIDIEEILVLQRSAQDAAELASLGNQFQPDAPGCYTFRLHEYREYPGAPRFPGDPAGARRRQLLAVTEFDVDIGDYVDLPIRTVYGDGADLRLLVVAGTVREASIVNPVDEKSRQATLKATVVAALTALEGQAVTSIGTALPTQVDDLLDNYIAHLAMGSWHNEADNVNDFVQTVDNPGTNQAAIEILNELRAKLIGHLKTINDSDTWHDVGDYTNLPLVGTASNLAEATVLSADLRERVFERHIANSTVHLAADATNTLTAVTLLDTVIVEYLDSLLDETPAAVDNEPAGLDAATQLFGFE